MKLSPLAIVWFIIFIIIQVMNQQITSSKLCVSVLCVYFFYGIPADGLGLSDSLVRALSHIQLWC